MTTSVAESIAAKVASTLAGMTTSTNVFRDFDDALRSESFPAVVVELGGESAPTRVMIGYMDREVDVDVTILSKATSSTASPLTAGDAALVESHALIMADRTLGGVAFDVLEGATRRQRDGLGEHVAACTKTYSVHYRTTETSLT